MCTVYAEVTKITHFYDPFSTSDIVHYIHDGGAPCQHCPNLTGRGFESCTLHGLPGPPVAPPASPGFLQDDLAPQHHQI